MLSIKSEECFPIFGDIEKRNAELAMTREQLTYIGQMYFSALWSSFQENFETTEGEQHERSNQY
jgi:hypothetical protein